jgi:hypothetical protein
MLNRIRPWHHIVVGLVIALMALLAGVRVIGAGDDSLLRGESFDSKQVTIWPDGDDGVRVREIVDIDFGSNERHGYQRIIPNDFGAPVAVTVVTEADDTLDVVNLGGETRIRVGDPNITYTGRHRYELEYVLPDAGVSSGVLVLDVIGNEETFETDRFEVVLTGFDLGTTSCDTGSYGSFGGCELVRDDTGNYVAVIAPLAPNDGITVGGRIDGLTDVELPPARAQPDGAASGFAPLGLLMIPIGMLGAASAFYWNRRRGSNDVSGAGGAADAAFGGLPSPGARSSSPVGPTRRVTDRELARMATIEFVPPRGLDPWQGMALLRESVDDQTVLAWFSGMVAREALVVTGSGSDAQLVLGPKHDRLSLVDQAHVARLFAGETTIELGTYDPDFASTWRNVADEQEGFIEESGWWNTKVRGSGGALRKVVTGVVVIAFTFVFFNVGALFAAAGVGVLSSPWFAIVLGFLVPFLVARLVYGSMLPSRTATGSALALRTESFRRFLASSEGKHVDWAWEHGVLREYSAWAVALGAAEAWSRAIGSSNIPDPTAAMSGPMLMYTLGPTFASTHTAPSSSGSSGGGFSGGGTGGGGGGGSSGSW